MSLIANIKMLIRIYFAPVVMVIALIIFFFKLIYFFNKVDIEENKLITSRQMIGNIYLFDNKHKNIHMINVWSPKDGFQVGSGCLGKEFAVNFSAISLDNKYIEGAVCCSDSGPNSCRYERYFVK